MLVHDMMSLLMTVFFFDEIFTWSVTSAGCNWSIVLGLTKSESFSPPAPTLSLMPLWCWSTTNILFTLFSVPIILSSFLLLITTLTSSNKTFQSCSVRPDIDKSDPILSCACKTLYSCTVFMKMISLLSLLGSLNLSTTIPMPMIDILCLLATTIWHYPLSITWYILNGCRYGVKYIVVAELKFQITRLSHRSRECSGSTRSLVTSLFRVKTPTS